MYDSQTQVILPVDEADEFISFIAKKGRTVFSGEAEPKRMPNGWAYRMTRLVLSIDEMMEYNEFRKNIGRPTHPILMPSISTNTQYMINKLASAGYFVRAIQTYKSKTLDIYNVSAHYAKGTDKEGEISWELDEKLKK